MNNMTTHAQDLAIAKARAAASRKAGGK